MPLRSRASPCQAKKPCQVARTPTQLHVQVCRKMPVSLTFFSESVKCNKRRQTQQLEEECPMAKSIRELVEATGAKFVGEVPDVGGGTFSMAYLAHILQER